MTSIRIGDSISSAGPGAVPVRFAGIQYARNFAVQPGFLTMPLLARRGQRRGRLGGRRLRQQRAPGQPAGRAGPVRAHRHPGPERRRHGPDRRPRPARPRDGVGAGYYASTQLLRRGLHDFSYEAGFVREDFGRRSNRYGEFMASTTPPLRPVGPGHRARRTPRRARTAQMAGAAVTALVFDLAQVGGSASVSHGRRGIGYRDRRRGRAPRTGPLVRRPRRTCQRRLRLHRHVGPRPRAPLHRPGASPTPALPFGSVGFNLTHRGMRERPRREPRRPVRHASASAGRVSLQAYARHSIAGRSDTVAGIHLAFAFGGRRSASAGLEAHRRGVNGTARLPAGPAGRARRRLPRRGPLRRECRAARPPMSTICRWRRSAPKSRHANGADRRPALRRRRDRLHGRRRLRLAQPRRELRHGPGRRAARACASMPTTIWSA